MKLIKKVLLNWFFLIFWWCLGFDFYLGFNGKLGLFLVFLNLILIISFKVTKKIWLFLIDLIVFLSALFFLIFWPNRYECGATPIPTFGEYISNCDCYGISWQKDKNFKCYTLR